MPQLLLFPDPKPLVERLGADFFRQAPECPGVYLMRDAADTILYVGKAKNLRNRLANYRVANPERLARRHLKLLRAVARIELLPCATEVSALAKESALLRSVRPRFNRAGTWPGPERILGWRLQEAGLELGIHESSPPGWHCQRALGAAAIPLRAALLRLLWCAIHPQRGLLDMPAGWFAGRRSGILTIPPCDAGPTLLAEAANLLVEFFAGRPALLLDWLAQRSLNQELALVTAVRESDLATLSEFAARCRSVAG